MLAHAFYPYEFGSFGGDVHFDEDEDWDPEGRMERTDFLTVAVTVHGQGQYTWKFFCKQFLHTGCH